MELSHVTIQNYRCHQHLEVHFDDLTILLGPNGSGKSAILSALSWFFEDDELDVSDFTAPTGSGKARNGVDESEISDGEPISVTVEFTGLNSSDRAVLGRYARKDSAVFTRQWSPDTASKIFGNSLQGPGFAKVRKEKRAREAQPIYRELTNQVDGLPAWQSHAVALDAWENDPPNKDRLEPVSEDDASHLFGFTGDHKLSQRFRMVLVPASADLFAEVGEAGRNSILSKLVGNVTSSTIEAVQAEWRNENAHILSELDDSVRNALLNATKGHEEQINALLSELVQNAKVTLRGAPPDFDFKKGSQIFTDVTVDERSVSIDRQGHGIQRAVMIAVLRALALEGSSSASQSTQPSLLLALEEPEIYQHPIRARHFGRVLSGISAQSGFQVAMTTHSPYLLRPEAFPSIRRLQNISGRSHITYTTTAQVAQRAALLEDKIAKCLMREVVGEFGEAFFADLVVLVEGITDKIVIEAAAIALNEDLDRHGIAVVAMSSKSALEVPTAVLTDLNIPVYVLADGDHGTAARKHPTDATKEHNAHDTHRIQTEGLLTWLRRLLPDTEPVSMQYMFGDLTHVGPRWTIFRDDLEAEMEKSAELVNEIQRLGGSLRGSQSKDVAIYREAIEACDPLTLPQSLRDLIVAITSATLKRS